jgi:hypothetical protein
VDVEGDPLNQFHSGSYFKVWEIFRLVLLLLLCGRSPGGLDRTLVV